MTPPKLSDLSPEQKRILIAEKCGWRHCRSVADLRYGKPKDFSRIQQLPDYLTSLDAMHEAEKVLMKGNHYEQYVYKLVEVMKKGTFDSSTYLREAFVVAAVHATASQRADAFLLATGAATE